MADSTWGWLKPATEFMGSDAFKNIASITGSGLSAYGNYKSAQNQKKQFEAMFDLDKAQLARDNKKEDDRQDTINSIYAPKLKI
ncbi:MAG: hypothetical protein GQ570_15045 [Helicobacteraceae bacterium]|nr:hypothetical protein [Helicobacteraceae bacterium]